MDSRRFTAIRAAGSALLPVCAALAVAAPASAATGTGIARSGHVDHRHSPVVEACPVGAPVQTITVRNDVGAAPAAIQRLERAVTAQAVQLRQWWRTPCVTWGSGGWQLTLADAVPPLICGNDAGCHWAAPNPAVAVGTSGGSYAQWSVTFSHEVMETLADPQMTGREVCDPVQDGSYWLDGVQVSDFVTPAWFKGGRGPFDAARLVDHAHELY